MLRVASEIRERANPGDRCQATRPRQGVSIKAWSAMMHLTIAMHWILSGRLGTSEQRMVSPSEARIEWMDNANSGVVISA